MRITENDLNQLLKAINVQAGHGEYPMFGTVGAYALSYAYGGVELVQYTSEGGGERSISPFGHGPKRELHAFMAGMVRGVK